MTQTRRLLVTGGAGFIGSYVNKLLGEKGYSSIVLDDLSKGKKEYVVSGELVVGNIGDRQLLKDIFAKGIDAVLHFAAFTNVGESVEEPYKYYENNVVNTLILLEEMKNAGVNKLIFSSSAAVYGNPLEEPITENHPKNPINPYGETKRVVESLISSAKSYGLEATCLRYFNAAGGDPEGKLLYKNPEATNLIPILLSGLKKNKPFTLFGNDYPTPDGTCIRDYIHIHDLATAHVLALENLKGDVYNLGNGAGFSVLEVIASVEKMTGLKVNLNIGPRRAGDPAKLLADSSKARRELLWKPTYPALDQMVKDAWRGYNS